MERHDHITGVDNAGGSCAIIPQASYPRYVLSLCHSSGAEKKTKRRRQNSEDVLRCLSVTLNNQNTPHKGSMRTADEGTYSRQPYHCAKCY
jgi:hypothetical protein